MQEATGTRGNNREEGKKRIRKRGAKISTVEVENQVEAVMFVPSTPEGELAKWIQEEDDKLREGTGERRLKIVERGGEPSERNCVGTTHGGTVSARGKDA